MRTAVTIVAAACMISAAIPVRAGQNVDPDHSTSWAPNLGWVHWRPAPEVGASIGRYFCSGYLYAQNAGWIHLGNGLPADGRAYLNNNASDYGINVDPFGNLRGLAYAPNIGWITFEDTGAARLDFVTGELSGHAYAANTGWITLAGTTGPVRILQFSPSPDVDQDGLPDPWELSYTDNLAELSGASDTDHDSASDYAEFQAGTNPFDSTDRLIIVRIELLPGSGSAELTWTRRPDRVYRIERSQSLGASGDWREIDATSNPDDDLSASASIPTDPESARQYYRIAAIPLLAEP